MVSPKLTSWLTDYLTDAERDLGTDLTASEYTGKYKGKKLQILHLEAGASTSTASSELLWATAGDESYSICCKIKRDIGKHTVKGTCFSGTGQPSGPLVPGAILKLQTFRPVFTRIYERIKGNEAPRLSAYDHIALEVADFTVEQAANVPESDHPAKIESIEQIQRWQAKLRQQDEPRPEGQEAHQAIEADMQQLPMRVESPHAKICDIVAKLYFKQCPKAVIVASTPATKARKDPLCLEDPAEADSAAESDPEPLAGALPRTPATKTPFVPAISPVRLSGIRNRHEALHVALPKNFPRRTSPPPAIPRRTPSNEVEIILVPPSDVSMSQSQSQSQPWSQSRPSSPQQPSQALPTSSHADAPEGSQRQDVVEDAQPRMKESGRPPCTPTRGTDPLRASEPAADRDRDAGITSHRSTSAQDKNDSVRVEERPGQHQPTAWSKPSFINSAQRRKQAAPLKTTVDPTPCPSSSTGGDTDSRRAQQTTEKVVRKDAPGHPPKNDQEPQALVQQPGSSSAQQIAPAKATKTSQSAARKRPVSRNRTRSASSDDDLETNLRPAKKQKLEGPEPSGSSAKDSRREPAGVRAQGTHADSRGQIGVESKQVLPEHGDDRTARRSTSMTSGKKEGESAATGARGPRRGSDGHLERRRIPPEEDDKTAKRSAVTGKRKTANVTVDEGNGARGSRAESHDRIGPESKGFSLEQESKTAKRSTSSVKRKAEEAEEKPPRRVKDPRRLEIGEEAGRRESSNAPGPSRDLFLDLQNLKALRTDTSGVQKDRQETSKSQRDQELSREDRPLASLSSKSKGKQKEDPVTSVGTTSEPRPSTVLKTSAHHILPANVPRIRLEPPEPKHMVSWASIRDILGERILEKYDDKNR